jgi:menaquinone-dependent protoporphyrinogen oxidase
MNLAILYATKYGSTRDAAAELARLVTESGASDSEVQVIDLARAPALPEATTVVIGAPIYAGKIPKAVSRFVDANLDALLERRVGLYLSCLYGEERAERQLADNFPPRLVAHSFGRYYVGGRVKLGELRWLDRVIMKRVGGVDHDVDTLNAGEIARLAADVTTG